MTNLSVAHSGPYKECRGWACTGLDFASFGTDLAAAQAAALQYYGAQSTADANRRAVVATTSVGTLLNGDVLFRC